MEEEYIRSEVQHAIREAGFDDYHPPDIKQTETGRPDVFGLNPRDACIVIEVKKMDELVRVEPWIPFSIISDSQRNWLDWWYVDRKGLCFIAIGTTFGSPRRLWVIPWERWVAYEKWKSPDGKDARAELCDLDKYFQKYELIWKGSRVWEFKTGHPIYDIAVRYHSEDDWTTQFSYRFELEKKVKKRSKKKEQTNEKNADE